MRKALFAAAACAAALATGCVSASTQDTPHVERELLQESYVELLAERTDLEAGRLRVRLLQGIDRTYDQTTRTDRRAVYTHWALSAATVQAPEHPAGRIALIPVALVASALDLVAWVITAPVAYPAGAFMAIDPADVREEVTETGYTAVAGGEVVLVSVGNGPQARRVAATAAADGHIHVVIAEDAEPALTAGRTTLPVTFALQSAPDVTGEYEVGLPQLLALVERQIIGDFEEQHFRWRRIHDAVPADAPGAGAVKAALMKKIAPLEKAIR